MTKGKRKQEKLNPSVGSAKTQIPKLVQELPSFEEAAHAIAQEIADLVILKQRDYGKNAIETFGEAGIIVRVNDKVSRLANLLTRENGGKKPVSEDSIEDSWKDLVGYVILALMLRRGLFGLPMKED